MPDENAMHLKELLNDFDTAMLITYTADGRLRARPMAVAEVAGDGSLWFLTGYQTGKVNEIERDERVHITLQDERSRYVSLSGRGRLSRERSRIDELWRPAFKVWFPGGKEDPDLVLIRVVPEEAEYWDQQGMNKVRYALQSAKALATGTTPDIQPGEQYGRVRL